MKFGRYLEDNVVPEWRLKYISYGKLKKLIKACKEIRKPKVVVLSTHAGHDPNVEIVSPHELSNSENSRQSFIVDQLFSAGFEQEDRVFFQVLDEQVHKCNDFYIEQLEVAQQKLDALTEQCRLLDRFASSQSGPSISRNDIIGSNQHIDAVKISKNPRRKLAQAVKEFYRLLELIKNFRILNQTALRKILKKYEKGTGHNTASYSIHISSLTIFHQDSTIDRMILATEQLYTDYIIVTKIRKDAMKELRLPVGDEYSNQAKAWRAGMLFGISLSLIVSIVRAVWDTSTNDFQSLFLIQIWSGLSIPILFLFLFSFTIQVWHQYRINWILIFELDPRKSLQPNAFTELASTLLLLYSALAYITLSENFFGLPRTYYPVLLVGLSLLLLLNPLPIFHPDSRQWLRFSLGRVLLSGLLPVQFRDFFLCDLMSSLTFSFVSIQASFCIAIHDPSAAPTYCSLDRSWGPSLVAALPAWWRFAQCLRRYYDDGLAHPHLTNAVKYVFSISVIVLSLASKFSSNESLRALWIAISIIASIYAFLWDVLFDWGLLSKVKTLQPGQHAWLREVITYPPLVYYVAVIINFILRFSWVFLLSPSYWSIVAGSKYLVYLLALLEVARRCMWAVIRMENEHCNNVGKFRAVKELPLPFTVTSTPSDDDDQQNDVET